MAAAIRVEVQRQAVPAKHLVQGAKRRGRAFLRDQKGRKNSALDQDDGAGIMAAAACSATARLAGSGATILVPA